MDVHDHNARARRCDGAGVRAKQGASTSTTGVVLETGKQFARHFNNSAFAAAQGCSHWLLKLVVNLTQCTVNCLRKYKSLRILLLLLLLLLQCFFFRDFSCCFWL